jgi:hypothetical protein
VDERASALTYINAKARQVLYHSNIREVEVVWNGVEFYLLEKEVRLWQDTRFPPVETSPTAPELRKYLHA